VKASKKQKGKSLGPTLILCQNNTVLGSYARLLSPGKVITISFLMFFRAGVFGESNDRKKGKKNHYREVGWGTGVRWDPRLKLL